MNDATIFVVGMSHKTAPVDIRERMGLTDELVDRFLRGLITHKEIDECMVLSTCNRVEILGCTDDVTGAVDISIDYLGHFHGKNAGGMRKYFYVKEGSEAVSHVFRVTAALDSMVIGEPQILGQVKDSYRAATHAETTGVILNRLMHRAFFVAKRIRNETEISQKPVSLASAAVWCAEDVLGSLIDKKVLMLGAGEMGEETLKNLSCTDRGDIFVANRTKKSAQMLADQYGANIVSWDDLASGVKEVDLVISTTGSREPVITKTMIEKIMNGRSRRPIVLIDIAVPRDVEKGVGEMGGVTLYNIDDLKGVVASHMKEREVQAKISEKIIDEELDKFIRWMKSLAVVPTIVTLRSAFKEIGREELKKTLDAWDGIDDEGEKRLKRLTTSIINKILHAPTVYLKKGMGAEGRMTLDDIQEIFGLAGKNGEED
jgi:glutamyl-tRNA reductase